MMKLLRISLGALFLLLSPTRLHAQEVEDILNRLEVGQSAIDVLLCVRGIVETRAMGTYGIEISAGILQEVFDHMDTLEPMGDLQEACESFRARSNPSDLSVDFLLEKIEEEVDDQRVQMILVNFLTPSVKCKKGGASASIAILIGVDAKIEVAKCRASNGRRWWQASLGGGIGLGALLDITAGGGSYEMTPEDFRDSRHGLSTSKKIDMAYILAYTHENSGEEDETNSHLFGLGVGLAGFFAGQYDLIVNRLPDDRGYIFQMYLS